MGWAMRLCHRLCPLGVRLSEQQGVVPVIFGAFAVVLAKGGWGAVRRSLAPHKTQTRVLPHTGSSSGSAVLPVVIASGACPRASRRDNLRASGVYLRTPSAPTAHPLGLAGCHVTFGMKRPRSATRAEGNRHCLEKAAHDGSKSRLLGRQPLHAVPKQCRVLALLDVPGPCFQAFRPPPPHPLASLITHSPTAHKPRQRKQREMCPRRAVR